MKPLYLTLPALLLLTACGGGGGGSTTEEVTPPSAEEVVDNAEGSDTASEEEKEDAVITVEETDNTPPDTPDEPVVAMNQTFNLTDASIIRTARVSQPDRVPALSDESLQAVYNTNGTITLTYNGRSVILGDTDGDGNFSGSANVGTDDETSGFLRRRYQGADNVETIFFNFSDAGTRLEGYVPVGDLSSAAAVTGQSGTATFRGLMNARIIGQEGTIPGANSNNGPDFVDGLGGGRMIVDFDGGTVSGRFNLNDPNAGLFLPAANNQFPRVLVELDSTIINGASFDGTANVTFKDDVGGFGNPDIAFDASTGAYSGAFYGDAANSAAGIVSGEIVNGTDRLVFQGGFATENSN